jgi:polysaccharide biosynthesis/export protein
MRNVFRLIRVLGTISVSLLALAPASATDTAYRISPGEIIELRILPFDDRTQRVEVQPDGTISIAEAGSLPVAGLTPREMQARIEMILTKKVFRLRGQNGVVQTLTLEPGEITAAVVGYKPVYVSGDVLVPGEHAYRPTMTVRQVLAVSGGLNLIQTQQALLPRQRADNVLDIQRDYELAWINYVKQYFHRERLRAEVDGKAEFEQRAPEGTPLAQELMAAIAQAEANELKLSIQSRAEQKTYMESAIKAATDQAHTLETREKVETQAQEADEADVHRIAALLKTGATSNSRLAEARRFLMFSSSRRLSTLVELQRMRNQRTDLLRQAAKAETETEISLLTSLREINAKLVDSEAELRSARAKLQSTGMAARSFVPNHDSLFEQIKIVRQSDGGWQHLAAENETEVLPGDVVEVNLCSPAKGTARECLAPNSSQ